jgi:DNA replicative helicase MCM subunit Mcm2 (Cdc46/Mcm family)
MRLVRVPGVVVRMGSVIPRVVMVVHMGVLPMGMFMQVLMQVFVGV